MNQIAYDLAGPRVTVSRWERSIEYVQHTIRQVLKRQHKRYYKEKQ